MKITNSHPRMRRVLARRLIQPFWRTRAVLLGLCLMTATAVLLFPGSVRSATGSSVTGSVSATPAKYLAETVVYLKGVPGRYSPKTVKMDQRAMKFIPHVLSITVGDTVQFWNHDTVPHNVFSPEGGYNLGTWPPGQHRDHKFEKAGAFSQLCSLHPEMLAYVFVGQNPYSAVVDGQGRFRLNDVPPGTYQLAVWNSHLKAAEQRIVVAPGKSVQASFALRR